MDACWCEQVAHVQSSVEGYWREMVAILDLFLRWAVLRFAEERQQTSVKVQCFLEALFTKMNACGVGTTDNEGNVFLPCICDKVGYKNDRVREGYNRLLTLFGSISNPHRFVMFLSQVRRPCHHLTLSCDTVASVALPAACT